MLENEGDREARQRIEKARQEGAIELDLSSLKLTELPESIASLTELQDLNREFQRSRVLGVCIVDRVLLMSGYHNFWCQEIP
jgi:hypothetical protein